jgi:rhodanese-related sulfurtransferase
MWGQPEVPGIDPGELRRRQAEGWTVVDVRTDEEWAQGRIRGSQHVRLDELVARMEELPQQVICVCAVGARSAVATQYLLHHGKDAVNLRGGVQAWSARGGALEYDLTS